MNNFKDTEDIYLYDGTIEGFFTLVYITYMKIVNISFIEALH